MKKNLNDRIRQHLEDFERFDTDSEESGYADTGDLWSYLHQSLQLLNKVLIESEAKEEKRDE